MVCQKCSNPFPATIVIDGKKRNLCTRKYCLDCSPFNSHNTTDLLNKKVGKECNCENCSKPYIYERDKGMTSKTCVGCTTTVRHRRLKLRAVQYLGGCCKICGYDKFMGALDFHHLDPSQKSFGLGTSWNRTWSSIETELDKCILLCRNCHSEVHGGVASLSAGSG